MFTRVLSPSYAQRLLALLVFLVVYSAAHTGQFFRKRASRPATEDADDPLSCRFLSREDRFGSPYVEGDDGSAWLAFFNVMSYVSRAGAPFAVAVGAYDVSEGNYLVGGLTIAGGLMPFAEEAVALRGAARGR